MRALVGGFTVALVFLATLPADGGTLDRLIVAPKRFTKCAALIREISVINSIESIDRSNTEEAINELKNFLQWEVKVQPARLGARLKKFVTKENANSNDRQRVADRIAEILKVHEEQKEDDFVTAKVFHDSESIKIFLKSVGQLRQQYDNDMVSLTMKMGLLSSLQMIVFSPFTVEAFRLSFHQHPLIMSGVGLTLFLASSFAGLENFPRHILNSDAFNPKFDRDFEKFISTPANEPTWGYLGEDFSQSRVFISELINLKQPMEPDSVAKLYALFLGGPTGRVAVTAMVLLKLALKRQLDRAIIKDLRVYLQKDPVQIQTDWIVHRKNDGDFEAVFVVRGKSDKWGTRIKRKSESKEKSSLLTFFGVPVR
jgi:hypothetical protein